MHSIHVTILVDHSQVYRTSKYIINSNNYISTVKVNYILIRTRTYNYQIIISYYYYLCNTMYKIRV